MAEPRRDDGLEEVAGDVGALCSGVRGRVSSFCRAGEGILLIEAQSQGFARCQIRLLVGLPNHSCLFQVVSQAGKCLLRDVTAIDGGLNSQLRRAGRRAGACRGPAEYGCSDCERPVEQQRGSRREDWILLAYKVWIPASSAILKS